ncbi:MAG: cytochrome C oxidase subunit IV family protein [Chloroflexi bacterium]|nr:cytochrome C oxidase subunit IV family protein [Chloroflexota bacterium]
MDETLEIKKKEAWRIGLGVLILLAALTLGEYWLGNFASAWWAPLLSVALLKAFLVVRDYMHLPRLFAPDEESH